MEHLKVEKSNGLKIFQTIKKIVKDITFKTSEFRKVDLYKSISWKVFIQFYSPLLSIKMFSTFLRFLTFIKAEHVKNILMLHTKKG